MEGGKTSSVGKGSSSWDRDFSLTMVLIDQHMLMPNSQVIQHIKQHGSEPFKVSCCL